MKVSRLCALITAGTLTLSFGSTSPAQERRLPGTQGEPVRTGPRDLAQPDSVAPVRDAGALLKGAEDPDPRLNVLAGVAWTPGLPGGGGGSGGPWEPAVADQYTVGDALPCLDQGTSCQLFGMSPRGRWLLGNSPLGPDGPQPCPESQELVTQRDRAAVVWELESHGYLMGTVQLPDPVGVAAGKRSSRAIGSNGRTLVVGSSFLRWATEDCSDPVNAHSSQAVAWQRQADGSWEQFALPTGTGAPEVGHAHAVNASGWIVGSLSVGPLDWPDFERTGAVVWLPDPAAPAGLRPEWLPTPPDADYAHATGVNDAGLVVGSAWFLQGTPDSFVRAVAWRRDLFGSWNCTLLDTLGGDNGALVLASLTSDGRVFGRSDTGIMEQERPNDPVTERVHAAEWELDWISGTWMGPRDLGTLGGYFSGASSAVGSELVVGTSTIDPRDRNSDRAVAWGAGDAVQLDTVTEGNWTFTDALFALPGGGIVVSGFEGRNGPTQDVILHPIE